MENEAQLIWDDVLKVIKTRYNDGKTLPWFERLIPHELTDTQLSCKTQLSFTIRVFTKQYKQLAEEILEQISMEPLSLVILEDDSCPDTYVQGDKAAVSEQGQQIEGAINPAYTVSQSPMQTAQNSGQVSQSTGAAKTDITSTVAQSTPGAIQFQPIMVYYNPETGEYLHINQDDITTTTQAVPTRTVEAPVTHPGQTPVTSTQSTIPTASTADLQRVETPVIIGTETNPEMNSQTQDLNKRTFETFVAGDSNNAAMVSAKRVAEMPGQVFNPFFLYSKSGLGKTHLMMAIKNYIQQYYPNKRVLYVTSEQFLQDYIKELAEYKAKQTGKPIMSEYRSVDVLLVDDIQFFEGKNESQEYFFATFEELVRRGAQIVLSADRSPKDLHMDERMTSRFQSGLCQSIQPPSYELKLAILKTFYQRMLRMQPWFEANLSDEILGHIAQVSSSNIREIEGFLTSVMVYANSKNQGGQVLTKADINSLAAESFNMRHKIIEIKTIQQEVAKHYQISRDTLIGQDRHKNINHARQVAMYLSRELTDESFASVGKYFGGRDHTTIMSGVQKIEKIVKKDRGFFDELEHLKDVIKKMS